MATIEMTAPTTPEKIFAVLADGWLYSGWVVGASHIRKVDPNWPEVGARIHHTVGLWPIPVKDTTSVVAVEPGRLLELDARAWPFGRARVRIELFPLEDGKTRIRMSEAVVEGPGKLIPEAIADPLLRARNRESLHRLIDLALGRGQAATKDGSAAVTSDRSAASTDSGTTADTSASTSSGTTADTGSGTGGGQSR